ncbi:hypothetical protein THAOC_36022 [Thalassiosira oceanica]|uniref:DUF6824 domain-containing protein n=1 Tax=Thalassiosira oceanica TaxID=159749 RepID=K0R926_THAOC|nr:hypothetical protein THAOC_36022 [Thalassiosira oceanica]|eukprot:EJK45366.1 hypothetical protein THAOC_36022 [Thalassiosira oceanica]
MVGLARPDALRGVTVDVLRDQFALPRHGINELPADQYDDLHYDHYNHDPHDVLDLDLLPLEVRRRVHDLGDAQDLRGKGREDDRESQTEQPGGGHARRVDGSDVVIAVVPLYPEGQYRRADQERAEADEVEEDRLTRPNDRPFRVVDRPPRARDGQETLEAEEDQADYQKRAADVGHVLLGYEHARRVGADAVRHVPRRAEAGAVGTARAAPGVLRPARAGGLEEAVPLVPRGHRVHQRPAAGVRREHRLHRHVDVVLQVEARGLALPVPVEAEPAVERLELPRRQDAGDGAGVECARPLDGLDQHAHARGAARRVVGRRPARRVDEPARELPGGPAHDLVAHGQAGVPRRYARHVHGVGPHLADELVHADADGEDVRAGTPPGAAHGADPLGAARVVHARHDHVRVLPRPREFGRDGIEVEGGGTRGDLRLAQQSHAVPFRQSRERRAHAACERRILPQARDGPRPGPREGLDRLREVLGRGGERPEDRRVSLEHRRGRRAPGHEHRARLVGGRGHGARESRAVRPEPVARRDVLGPPPAGPAPSPTPSPSSASADRGTMPFPTMAPTLALLESSPNVVSDRPYLLPSTPTPHRLALISSTIISMERCWSCPVEKNLSRLLSDMGWESETYPSNVHRSSISSTSPSGPTETDAKTDGSRVDVSWPESPPRRRTRVFLVTPDAAARDSILLAAQVEAERRRRRVGHQTSSFFLGDFYCSHEEARITREISLSSASSNESSADPVMRPDESGKPEQSEAASAAKRAKLEVPPPTTTPTSDGASTQAAVVDYLSAKRAELGMPPPSSSAPMAVAVAVSDETGDGDSGGSAVALANSAGHKTSSPGNNDDNDVIINSRTRNAQYLRMIKENRTAYAKAATRSERKAIVGSLMDQWRKRGGRFLTRQKGVDAEADDGLVQKKIATALRKPKAKKAAVVPLRPGRHVLPQLSVLPQKVFLGGSDYDCDEAASLFLAKEDERAKAAAAAPSTSRGEDGRGGGRRLPGRNPPRGSASRSWKRPRRTEAGPRPGAARDTPRRRPAPPARPGPPRSSSPRTRPRPSASGG